MKNPEPKETEDSVIPFNYQILQTIKLPKPISPLPIRFDTVVNSRKSYRTFQGLTLQQISDILWYAAKVKTLQLQENGYILTHRGTPSAGARHPIDIVICGSKILIDGYFYYYNPFQHSINQLISTNDICKAFVNHVNGIIDATNATIVWFVAHKSRTSAKYQNADSLIWRDAGALINGIQFISTAVGVNSCAVGSLGEPFISNFFQDKKFTFGVGGLLIG